MKSQQTSLDTISNNLANINTTGYKKERTEFQSLLYQTIQEKTTDHEGNPKPIGAQVGLGVTLLSLSIVTLITLIINCLSCKSDK